MDCVSTFVACDITSPILYYVNTAHMTVESTDIAQILNQHFPQIAEPELCKEIASVGILMHFQSGEVIMDYGSYVKMVPLIVNGMIKVTREDDSDDREMLLYFIGPGESCSMSFTCCMTSKQSELRTQAVEDTTIIGIPNKYMDLWMTKYQSWKNFIMQTYDRKMIEMVKVIDSIAFESMDVRLRRYLETRQHTSESDFIEVTHQEIANDLNASREAVSRLLKKLETNGEVELGRNQVRFLI